MELESSRPARALGLLGAVFVLLAAGGALARLHGPVEREPELPPAPERAHGPRIVSPAPGIARILRGPEGRVLLAAAVDSDVREVHWYAGARYLGKIEAGQPLFWDADPGKVLLRAVDDRGGSDVRELDIR